MSTTYQAKLVYGSVLHSQEEVDASRIWGRKTNLTYFDAAQVSGTTLGVIGIEVASTETMTRVRRSLLRKSSQQQLFDAEVKKTGESWPFEPPGLHLLLYSY